ncbi:hypothetical protein Strvi_1230 [Streptomyces violaceusniger Tu 4113]|uniref:Uncharacterized protein n=1 Tax=Streptomyces violaceusniger (strain Tu 4113) TaxID=653045 RepID=G2PBR1_STRV4|nr:hypothetical protein Strvi_1230 [Streptomyces violaceusniger Tu 4113]
MSIATPAADVPLSFHWTTQKSSPTRSETKANAQLGDQLEHPGRRFPDGGLPAHGVLAGVQMEHRVGCVEPGDPVGIAGLPARVVALEQITGGSGHVWPPVHG